MFQHESDFSLLYSFVYVKNSSRKEESKKERERESAREGNFFAYLIIPSSYFRFGAEKVARFTPLLRLSASGMMKKVRGKGGHERKEKEIRGH